MNKKKNNPQKQQKKSSVNNKNIQTGNSTGSKILDILKNKDNLIIIGEIALIIVLVITIALVLVGQAGQGNGGNNGGNNIGNNGGNNCGGSGGGGGSSGGSEVTKLQYKNYTFNYFDTVSTIIGYEVDGDTFGEVSKQALNLIGEYHRLFDIYNEYDGIVNLCSLNKVVDGQHRKLKVDRKIIDMLLYAKEMYEVTGGEMNIAMGSVLSIWHDYRTAGIDKPWEAELPPMDKLQEAAKHTNINDIIIDEENSTVWLSDPEMKLDVGAFAKGYAVEMVAKMLEDMGKTGYVINVGGNIRTIGTNANGDRWKTGIENPTGDEEVPYIEYIGLAGDAIVTSGSYQRYYYVGGKKYHHIIDPDTLMPSKGLLSVSIICKDSGMGDGLSTALFCMSIEDGMALIESLDGVEAIWVDESETKHYSSGFKNFLYD